MQCLVRKLKYDGTVRSEWEGELLAFDSAEWLLVTHYPAKHRKFRNGQQTRADMQFVHVLNTLRPITILLGYDENGQLVHAKCNAALPARQIDNVIQFIDLDLDVIVNRDSTFYVRDQEQFEQHRHQMGYSKDVVAAANAGVALAKTLVQTGAFPFGDQFIPPGHP